MTPGQRRDRALSVEEAVGSGGAIALAEGVVPHESLPPDAGRWSRAGSRRIDVVLVVLVALLALVAAVALAAPWIAPDNPTTQDLVGRLHAPALRGDHPLGTDELGRDVLSRVIYGTRVSLALGFGCSLVSATFGLVLGLVAGLRGGWIDGAVMRLVDAQLAFPFVVLAIAIVAVAGPHIWILAALLSWLGWAQFARLVRGEAQAAARQDYVLAARALGASKVRIAIRDVLPNLLPPVLIIATFNVAQVIIQESALSYLGVGVQAPTASWGGMLSEGQEYLGSAWWIAMSGGVALMLTVLLVNLIGMRVRRVLDPRRSA